MNCLLYNLTFIPLQIDLTSPPHSICSSSVDKIHQLVRSLRYMNCNFVSVLAVLDVNLCVTSNNCKIKLQNCIVNLAVWVLAMQRT